MNYLRSQLKILEVSSCYPPSHGGVERCVYELSTRFIRDGHQVKVATSTRGKKPEPHTEKIDDVTVVRFTEKYHLFEAPLIPRISLMALTEDYDVLHVHGMSPSITDLSILFARVRGKPVVLTYHNDAESYEWGGLAKLAAYIYGSLVSFLIREASVVVSSTRSYAETSIALKYSMDKLKIIPMGVDHTKYSGLEQTDVLEEPAQEMMRERNLLFVGQLKEYKGVGVLLEALYLLRAEGHPVNVDIVGTGTELESLRKKAKELGVEENARFRGKVSDAELRRLYETCDSLVLPSVGRREAFGIVLLEAMAAGRTVVASDIPGVNEVASKARGYLARPNDARSLADSIHSSFRSRRDPNEIRRVAAEHSWDKLASQYEAIFEDLVKKSQSNLEKPKAKV